MAGEGLLICACQWFLQRKRRPTAFLNQLCTKSCPSSSALSNFHGSGLFAIRFDMPEITRILQSLECGDAKAADELLPLVYDELRKLAAHEMALQPPGQTLQATALVHEAYLRLLGHEEKRWESRRHFFSAAAEAMRHILIDRARRRLRVRHGEKAEQGRWMKLRSPPPPGRRSCSNSMKRSKSWLKSRPSRLRL